MALGIYRENIISQCENNVKEKPASAPISTRSAACRSHSFCASLDYCDAFGYCATLNYRVALLLNAVSCSCRTYNTTRPRAARSAAIYSQTAAPASAACSAYQQPLQQYGVQPVQSQPQSFHNLTRGAYSQTQPRKSSVPAVLASISLAASVMLFFAWSAASMTSLSGYDTISASIGAVMVLFTICAMFCLWQLYSAWHLSWHLVQPKAICRCLLYPSSWLWVLLCRSSS